MIDERPAASGEQATRVSSRLPNPSFSSNPKSQIPNPGSSPGFTLIEILVALVVFAALAAITWGALGQIARTRGALAAQQDRFAAIVRTMSDLERDLRQTIARPVRGNYGEQLPAVLGAGDRLELSRLGFANPRAESRSNIERVLYAIDNRKLQRGRYAVLDRATGSMAESRELLDRVSGLRLRYLGIDGAWRDAWPARDMPLQELPRAIEFRLALEDFGELRRVIALPSTLPVQGVGSNGSLNPPGVPGSSEPPGSPLPGTSR
jgi:general secretion pathway protein J